MTRNELIEAAAALSPASREAAGEYRQKSEAMAAELNTLMGSRPDLETLIGGENRSMMEENHRNHARFISSLLISYSPDVFVHTVLWVFRAYRSHGFTLTYWPAQLDTWLQLFKKHLSQNSFTEIYPFYEFMLIHQPDFVDLSEPSPRI
jgi:hypothetical protein